MAVVAVDPSSPITGGALLGDRVRMQAYAGDRDVFIRSMAARGHAGGLASTTGAAAAVLDAVGFDLVLVETVGTGQSEVEVAAAADTTVVLEAPEMGDEVQAIKAGLLEVADLVVVNKGDKPGAQRTAAQLRAMLVAGRRGRTGGDRTDGTATGDGAPPAPAEAPRGPRHDRRDRRRRPGAARRARPAPGGRRRPERARRRRLARAEAQVWAIVADRIRDRLHEERVRADTRETLAAVADHRLDPYAAADALSGPRPRRRPAGADR